MGRAADSQPDPQEVLEALLGLMPACWQTLHTRQTANMLKMLRLWRSAVALALHNIVRDWNGGIQRKGMSLETSL